MLLDKIKMTNNFTPPKPITRKKFKMTNVFNERRQQYLDAISLKVPRDIAKEILLLKNQLDFAFNMPVVRSARSKCRDLNFMSNHLWSDVSRWYPDHGSLSIRLYPTNIGTFIIDDVYKIGYHYKYNDATGY